MGLMNLITRSYQAMFGVRRDQTEIDNWREGKGAPPDRPITTNPFPQPYQRPEDFDAYGRENDVMRMEYQRFYANESTLQSALDGKVAAIAALDISILPADENSQVDKYVAEFVRKAVANCSGGWPGLIQNMLQPAFVNGFSITEKWTGAVDTDLCFDRLRPMYNGLWAYRRLASIDTNKIRFQVNDVRDIVGIINTQWGLHGYSPERVVIYTHRKIFENPYGRSDIRSAYRACQMIENAYKLWYIALKNYSAPYIKAKTSATGPPEGLEQSARGGPGWRLADDGERRRSGSAQLRGSHVVPGIRSQGEDRPRGNLPGDSRGLSAVPSGQQQNRPGEHGDAQGCVRLD
ncbi:MAG: hypothetical protein U0798_15190 [Gemmataceae bacterium]